MKVADGPVTLELNGQGGDAGYLRWRDYHHSYPSGQRVVYVHQLVAIAHGADPYKVFTNGDYEVNHGDGAIENNSPGNLELMTHLDHWKNHVDN